MLNEKQMNSKCFAKALNKDKKAQSNLVRMCLF